MFSLRECLKEDRAMPYKDPIKRAQYDKERKKRCNMTQEQVEKDRKRKREYYKKNKDRLNKKRAENKRKQKDIKEKQKQWGRNHCLKNKDLYIKKSNEWDKDNRRKKNPYIFISDIIRKYENGNYDEIEFDNKLSSFMKKYGDYIE